MEEELELVPAPENTKPALGFAVSYSEEKDILTAYLFLGIPEKFIIHSNN